MYLLQRVAIAGVLNSLLSAFTCVAPSLPQTLTQRSYRSETAIFHFLDPARLRYFDVNPSIPFSPSQLRGHSRANDGISPDEVRHGDEFKAKVRRPEKAPL